MRRVDREIKAIDKVLEVVDKCKVCRIAMVDNNRPYVVPLNFGYTYKNSTLELYFHSALEGRKINILKENPIVCVEMDCEHELVENEQPCRNSYLFASVIGEGKVIFIEDIEEKKVALNVMMKHMTGKEFQFEDNHVKSVKVFKVSVSSFSCKAKKG